MSYPNEDAVLAPYYDLTEEEIVKEYTSLLFRPGKKIQNRELQVLQGLIYNAIKNVGNILTRTGSIISGGEVTTDLSSDPMTVRVAEAEVYIDGRVYTVPEMAETS